MGNKKVNYQTDANLDLKCTLLGVTEMFFFHNSLSAQLNKLLHICLGGFTFQHAPEGSCKCKYTLI